MATKTFYLTYVVKFAKRGEIDTFVSRRVVVPVASKAELKTRVPINNALAEARRKLLAEGYRLNDWQFHDAYRSG